VPRPENYSTPSDRGLTYETQRIQLANQEFLEAWFVPHPKAEGLVLLFPPYAGSKASLLEPAKILHDLGYNTLLIDFRGVGGSSGSNTTLGVQEATDVVAAIAYAKQRWEKQPILVYGASMGAVATMRAIAKSNVTVDAIILESPFDRLLTTVQHRFQAMGLPASPGAELIVFWGGIQQQINGFAHNPVEYAANIHIPVLLLHGTADQRVTTSEAEAIFQSLPKLKQLVFFPGAIGHGAIAHSHPVHWKQAVQQFLSKLK
jgi:hypothetical protein